MVDTATGAELFRRRMPMEITTSQLAFDGHAVAVNDGADTAGNRPAGGETHVIDIVTGHERTVDAVGLLPGAPTTRSASSPDAGGPLWGGCGHGCRERWGGCWTLVWSMGPTRELP